MIGVAVVVNAILLPILAHMGVFKAIGGQHLEPINLVSLPPEKKPPVPKKTPKKVTRKRAARPRPAAKAASRPATARPSRPNPNQPKLVVTEDGVAPSAGGGNGNGPGVENNGTGAAGQLPSSPPAANPAPPDAPAPTPPENPAPVTPTPVPPSPPVRPVVTPPPPVPPAPPHVPVVVAAQPVSQPQPKIPDDMDYDSIKGDFRAVFAIHADGGVSVQMTASTGNPTLDTLALDAARRWTFRPATVDGRPVSSYRRFVIQFEPS